MGELGGQLIIFPHWADYHFYKLSSIAQEEKFFAKHTIVDHIKMHKLNIKFSKSSRENNFFLDFP